MSVIFEILIENDQQKIIFVAKERWFPTVFLEFTHNTTEQVEFMPGVSFDSVRFPNSIQLRFPRLNSIAFDRFGGRSVVVRFNRLTN